MTYMLFNNINLKDHFTINDIRGRGIIKNDIETLEVAGKAGAYFVRKNIPVRVLEIDIVIASDSPSDMRKDIRSLNAILSVDEPKEIIFSDDDEISYFGIPADSQEGNEIVSTAEQTIVLLCADPYAYSKDEITGIFTSDAVKLTNEGSEEAKPIFTFEVKNPITFAMIQNQNNDYMMIGKPIDVVEDQTYERYERILHDEMSSKVGWATASDGDVDGLVTGEIDTNGTRFEPTDYGSGSSWHGPALKRSLTEPLTDFRMEAIVGFWNSEPLIVGRVELYLLDDQGRQVGKIGIKDTQNSQSLGWGEARVGDSSVNYYMINEYGDRQGNWNNFYGMLRLERIGKEWNAYIAKIDQSTGKHHTRRFANWTDIDDQFTREVSQVVVHFGQVRDHQTGATGVYDVKVFKINQENPNEIPYIAREGDIIIFDHENEELLINGEDATELKQFGGSYFNLIKGENQFIVQPSNSLNTSFRYKASSR